MKEENKPYAFYVVYLNYHKNVFGVPIFQTEFYYSENEVLDHEEVKMLEDSTSLGYISDDGLGEVRLQLISYQRVNNVSDENFIPPKQKEFKSE